MLKSWKHEALLHPIMAGMSASCNPKLAKDNNAAVLHSCVMLPVRLLQDRASRAGPGVKASIGQHTADLGRNCAVSDLSKSRNQSHAHTCALQHISSVTMSLAMSQSHIMIHHDLLSGIVRRIASAESAVAWRPNVYTAAIVCPCACYNP